MYGFKTIFGGTFILFPLIGLLSFNYLPLLLGVRLEVSWYQEGYYLFIWVPAGFIYSVIMTLVSPRLITEKTRKNIHNGEVTDYPVRVSMLKERGMEGCLLKGTVFDIGNPQGYKMCLNYMKNNPD